MDMVPPVFDGTDWPDVGKILAGIQVPDADQAALEEYLKGLGYPFWDETENTVYKRFLKKNDKSSVVGEKQ
jgi:hypothetical protein